MARSLFNRGRKKVTPLEMYTNMVIRKFQANSNNIDLSVAGTAQMKFGYDKIITANGIREYYKLVRIAMYMPAQFLEFLRTIETKEEVVGEGVSVNLCMKMDPHWIDWNTRQMSIRASVWEQDMQESEDYINQNKGRLVSDDEIAVNKQNTWLQKSWEYFKEMCSDNHHTPVVQVYIELATAVSIKQAYKNLKQASMELQRKAITNGFELKKIKGNLWDFQKLFCPVSAGNPRMEKSIERFPLTDTYVANMTDYSPGKLTADEVLMGMDIDTGKFVYKDFINATGGAEVLLIAAITGGGKSYFAKSIAFSILVNGYTLVVLDRDGEYIPIANEINGTVISMSRGTGKYYDSTVIAELSGDHEVDITLLINSQKATIAVFNVLADAENGMTSDELAVFNDAYKRLYEKYGIDKNDMSTWERSKNLSFHKLYNSIVELKKDKSYMKKYRNTVEGLIDKLRVFFEPDGIYSYLFKVPISITDVLNDIDGNAPMVVVHMDLEDDAGKDSKDKPTFIKLITTNYLVDTILTHNRKLNKFTFLYVEEFQRYLYNTFAKGIVVTLVTGGRKKNANVIVITNNPDELAESVVKDTALQAIRDNITSAMIGKIKSQASIDNICTNLGLLGCNKELMSMLTDSQLPRHSFVSKFDDNEAAIIRAVVPPEYRDTVLFKTRTLKGDVKLG